ncbi:MBL fold metallo-hydrolase [Mycolicibacterium stellerae]|uniref:MBL fold metallo-hydrolase n=1 Tax=Mycolicibacterium stellerae TaxID=2358193 RepID=UPI000F0B24E4|nr:MBL fold metallo-hydrolase [Mycolicibacterium stellerae]
MNFAWERLNDSVHRCRLPFLDVTVGLVHGAKGTLLIDTGTTLTEANAIKADVAEIVGDTVGHIVLTHYHFDHILGSSAFAGAAVYCAPEVVATIANRTEHLHADAVRYGADPDEVANALSALRAPESPVSQADIDLGGVSVAISHPGRGHTRHDLIVVVEDAEVPVVFCGDLVEESGDPVFDRDSDLQAWPSTLGRVLDVGGPGALFVPGHGAVVDAGFVQRQQEWLRDRV